MPIYRVDLEYQTELAQRVGEAVGQVLSNGYDTNTIITAHRGFMTFRAAEELPEAKLEEVQAAILAALRDNPPLGAATGGSWAPVKVLNAFIVRDEATA